MRRGWHTILLLAATAVIGRAQTRPFAPAAPDPRPAGAIDVLDYFLQSDDRRDEWTLGGTDVRPAPDPDGASVPTLVLNKWSSPDCYEVYHVTPTDLRLRYEVTRWSGQRGADNWVRRFEELAPDGSLGAVWCKRLVTPGQPGFLSRFRQDRLTFDTNSRTYVPDPAGSAKSMSTYLTVTRASNNWGRNNQTLFDLSDSIRLTSEWQDEGKILEMYDYARGKGLIAWRWLERLSTLPPVDGNVYRCEEGHVYVAPSADPAFRPTVYRYDPKTKERGPSLEVVKFTSHWRPDLGEQWYVVYRDTTREGALTRKSERVEHTYALPEWDGRPGATIADLPHVFTAAPVRR